LNVKAVTPPVRSNCALSVGSTSAVTPVTVMSVSCVSPVRSESTIVSDPLPVAVTVPEVMEIVSLPTNELVPGNVPTSSRTTVKPSLF
jgi:hypothetical protein